MSAWAWHVLLAGDRRGGHPAVPQGSGARAPAAGRLQPRGERRQAGSASTSALNRPSAPNSSALIRRSASRAMKPISGGAWISISRTTRVDVGPATVEARPDVDRERARGPADRDDRRRPQLLHRPGHHGAARGRPHLQPDAAAHGKRRIEQLRPDHLGQPARQVLDPGRDAVHRLGRVGELERGADLAHQAGSVRSVTSRSSSASVRPCAAEQRPCAAVLGGEVVERDPHVHGRRLHDQLRVAPVVLLDRPDGGPGEVAGRSA